MSWHDPEPSAWLTALGVSMAVAAIAMVVFGLHAAELVNLKLWGPRIEEARHEKFTNSTAYLQGKAQTLSRLRREYIGADAAHREGIRSMVVHEASTVDLNKLDNDLAGWVRRVQEGGI